jgi:SAM-dependent methyltransferase
VDLSEDTLPFKDRYFDYVIILETLEHLKSPQSGIEEIQRVLKKGGIMLASVPNPRTDHKLMYPCLFKFGNFKRYLSNNRFSVRLTTTYGICPPFWKRLRKRVAEKWNEQRNEIDVEKGESTKFSKLALLLSNNFFTKIKPKIYGWSFIYQCENINPSGAKEQVLRIL